AADRGRGPLPRELRGERRAGVQLRPCRDGRLDREDEGDRREREGDRHHPARHARHRQAAGVSGGREVNLASEGLAMTRPYNVVDADGHILEPLDLWDTYMDPAFRERRPRFVIDENGKERLSVEGKLLGNPRGIGSLGSVGARAGIVKPNTLKYAEGRRGGFDPHARIV